MFGWLPEWDTTEWALVASAVFTGDAFAERHMSSLSNSRWPYLPLSQRAPNRLRQIDASVIRPDSWAFSEPRAG
jgi:hypothetical protein